MDTYNKMHNPMEKYMEDRDSEPTMQSYLRQEYEAVSLAVKIHTATCLQGMGVKPINLQHDGLVMTAG